MDLSPDLHSDLFPIDPVTDAVFELAWLLQDHRFSEKEFREVGIEATLLERWVQGLKQMCS